VDDSPTSRSTANGQRRHNSAQRHPHTPTHRCRAPLTRSVARPSSRRANSPERLPCRTHRRLPGGADRLALLSGERVEVVSHQSQLRLHRERRMTSSGVPQRVSSLKWAGQRRSSGEVAASSRWSWRRFEPCGEVRPVDSVRSDPGFHRSDRRRLLFVRFTGVPPFWRLDLDVRTASVADDPHYDCAEPRRLASLPAPVRDPHPDRGGAAAPVDGPEQPRGRSRGVIPL
jgi:hypothetical protein